MDESEGQQNERKEVITGCGQGCRARPGIGQSSMWTNRCCRKWQQEKDEGQVCDPGTWLEDIRGTMVTGSLESEGLNVMV